MPPKPSSSRPGKAAELTELTERFLGVLERTLDLKQTTKELNISEARAREIISKLRSGLAARTPAKTAPRKAAPPKAGEYTVFVDGAARGNPGEAGAGAVITGPDGVIVKEVREYLGVATNNVAEYRALLMALNETLAMGIKKVRICADSELMVKQVNGVYRVKNEGLKPLYSEAVRLLKGFSSYSVTHVRREKNKEADRLANEAVDSVR